MRSTIPFVLLSLAPAIAATAQTPAPKVMPMPAPVCTAPAALPPAFAGFAHPVPAAQGSEVLLGEAATLDLAPGTQFAVPPGHAPAGGTFGGTLGFDVTDPGTYRVAVGAAIWIDVVRDGASVKSTAHDRGPACTAVRKTVDFALTPGHYVLQLSGSDKPGVTVQVAKASSIFHVRGRE